MTDSSQPTCFFITPFSGESAGGEAAEVFEAVQAAIRDAADSAGITLRRADDIFEAGVVIDQIRGEIERADLVVAVCTGRNANVFYELGLAEAAFHKPVLVAASSNDLPFDVQHWRAQLYGPPLSVDDLADRVARALTETLASAPPERPIIVEESQASSTDRPIDLIRSGDDIGFVELAKDRIRESASEVEQVSVENWESKPTDETLGDLRDIRFSSVERLVSWLAPAIEYRSDLLVAPLRQLRPWFDRTPGDSHRGYEFWISQHQAWTSLTLKALVGISLAYSSGPALEQLLALSGDRLRDEGPLLTSPTFTWTKGYHGNSDIAFKDFGEYIEWSATASQVIAETGIESSLHLACGVDLAIGLARCVFESTVTDLDTLPTGSRVPDAYAAFAPYHCDRIQWAARLLHNDEKLAVGLGASGLEAFRVVAGAWYPYLIQRTGSYVHTCDSWHLASS